jgi:hypothetical protein
MKIRGVPQLNISYLHDVSQKTTRFYSKKSAFLPDFSTILLKRLQVGLITTNDQ